MDLRRSILNQTDNSFQLARPLLSKDSNLVFSPLSIHLPLGMIAAGSDGPTRDQIVHFVTSTSSDELTAFFSQVVTAVLADGSPASGPVLSTANGLWVDLSLRLKPAYRDLLHSLYGAVSEHVDFQNKPKEVREEVNELCSKATKGVIKDILPPAAVVPLLTRLILANAVYFKAEWSERFHKRATKKHEFYLLNGSSVRAPMMADDDDEPLYFRAFDGFKVLRLPYEQGFDTRVYSMFIYLPDSVDGLPSLRERFCSDSSAFFDSHLPYYKIRLDKLLIPKFKISFGFEASDLLKRLGLELPFEGGALTEMVESCSFPLAVNGIFHKAAIEVNEKGTVATAAAGAASSAVVCGGGGPPQRGALEFVADHPFMFVIKEDTTGIVLFIGQLLNPLALT